MVCKRPASGMMVPYELRPSPIAGIGIFATAPIARGTLVWEYVVGVSVSEHTEASLRARLRGMASADTSELLEHVYVTLRNILSEAEECIYLCLKCLYSALKSSIRARQA